jgi:hypothetical protein
MTNWISKPCLLTVAFVAACAASASAGTVERMTICVGSPDAWLGAARPNERLATLERLQTAPLEHLPVELRDVATAHAAMAGVKGLDAVITRECIEPGGTITNTYAIQGQVRHDGSFAVTSSTPGMCEGAPIIGVTELAFDGASFFVGTPGNPTYTAYASTSTSIDSALGMQASFMEPLRAWVYSPFWITQFPGTAYARAVVGGGDNARVSITETYPGMLQAPALAGRTVYTLRVTQSGTHPVAIEHLDSGGHVQIRREYGDYRELAPGVWRPMEIVERRFRDGKEPFLVETTRIRAALPMTRDESAAPLPRPRPEENRWRVHHGA